MEQFNQSVNSVLLPMTQNSIILSVVSLILVVYAIQARPKLPDSISKLFNNPLFRVAMLSYILYKANHDPTVSIIVVVVFLGIMHMVNRKNVDSFMALSTFNIAANEYNKEQFEDLRIAENFEDVANSYEHYGYKDL